MSIDFTNTLHRGAEQHIEWATKTAPIYGAVNGYVRLPEGHPWRELELQMADYGVVDVHGGITYGPDENGWIGFDTLHAFDFWPGMGREQRVVEEIEWTPEAVVEETVKLARQAAAALTEVSA